MIVAYLNTVLAEGNDADVIVAIGGSEEMAIS